MSRFLFLIILILPFTSFANETVIRCRGTGPAEDLYFHYDMSTEDQVIYQVHLTYSRGYNHLVDDGWRTLTSVDNKISAHSPWPDLTAVLKHVGERWDLILTDKTGSIVTTEMFDNFVCVPREH